MKILVRIISVLSLVFIIACVATPDSGRSAFIVIPLSQEMSMGQQAYKEILAKEKETTNIELKQMVERVGRRLAAVSAMPNLEWEFKVIDSEQKNAFALPGGKTAIYTGLLPVCLNEAGLAAVLGHEIAHVTARHSGQRMSQQFLLMGALSAAQISLSNNNHRDTILGALGVGAMYGIQLPFGRGNESEADSIGLKYMARAGYDPSEAVIFWTRFSNVKGGQAPPEFLSTHPSDNTRIRNLQKYLPRAMVDYRASKAKFGKGKNFPVITSQPAPPGK